MLTLHKTMEKVEALLRNPGKLWLVPTMKEKLGLGKSNKTLAPQLHVCQQLLPQLASKNWWDVEVAFSDPDLLLSRKELSPRAKKKKMVEKCKGRKAANVAYKSCKKQTGMQGWCLLSCQNPCT